MIVGQEMYHKTYHGRVIVLGEPNASGLVMVADANDREHEFYTKVEKLRERKAPVLKTKVDRPRTVKTKALHIPESIGLFAEEPWVQHLMTGYLTAAAHDSYLARVTDAYYQTTGVKIDEGTHGLVIRRGDCWRAYSLKIQVWTMPVELLPPSRYVVHHIGPNNFQVTNTQLCWELIRLGMRIGSNQKGESQ